MVAPSHSPLTSPPAKVENEQALGVMTAYTQNPATALSSANDLPVAGVIFSLAVFRGSRVGDSKVSRDPSLKVKLT